MKINFFGFFILIPFMLNGQKVLDEYVRYGLENNLALQQKQAAYDKSIEALREARAMFYPSLSFNARYTRAEGGRVIDFPVGDLLNPVYMTLNALTSSNMFPLVENQTIEFFRPREQETKLRMIQPVVNPAIYYNSKIRKELTFMGELDLTQYRRELKAEIKKAYYNAANAARVLSMLNDTRSLLLENIRVNRKLIENDKITPDNLYRSETELSKFDQELQNAQKNNNIAAAYFNFLLNRPLTDSIMLIEPDVLPPVSAVITDAVASAVENREELKKLENYTSIADLQLKINKTGKIPDMFIAVDYGFEGTEYRFTGDHDYLMASAVLSWNLFSGFRNRSKIRQSAIDKEMAERSLQEARRQIELQVINSLNEIKASEKTLIAAEARLKNAREGFRLVNRKYEEGQANLIEFIDARTTLTQAEENLIISKFSYLSALAEFEKVTAVTETN